MQSYIILDFETGGFESQSKAVTEFAGLSITGDTLQEITQYEAILKPYHPELEYDQQALRSTGITMEMLDAGLDLKSFGKEFLKFIKDSTPQGGEAHKPVIVGHNVQFDIAFLQQLFHYIKADMSKYLQGRTDFYGNFYPEYINTITLSKLKWGNEPVSSYKLADCVGRSGCELINAHRAMNDVKSTRDLLLYFINLYREQQIADSSSEELITSNRFRDKPFKF